MWYPHRDEADFLLSMTDWRFAKWFVMIAIRLVVWAFFVHPKTAAFDWQTLSALCTCGLGEVLYVFLPPAKYIPYPWLYSTVFLYVSVCLYWYWHPVDPLTVTDDDTHMCPASTLKPVLSQPVLSQPVLSQPPVPAHIPEKTATENVGEHTHLPGFLTKHVPPASSFQEGIIGIVGVFIGYNRPGFANVEPLKGVANDIEYVKGFAKKLSDTNQRVHLWCLTDQVHTQTSYKIADNATITYLTPTIDNLKWVFKKGLTSSASFRMLWLHLSCHTCLRKDVRGDEPWVLMLRNDEKNIEYMNPCVIRDSVTDFHTFYAGRRPGIEIPIVSVLDTCHALAIMATQNDLKMTKTFTGVEIRSQKGRMLRPIKLKIINFTSSNEKELAREYRESGTGKYSGCLTKIMYDPVHDFSPAQFMIDSFATEGNTFRLAVAVAYQMQASTVPQQNGIYFGCSDVKYTPIDEGTVSVSW
ncbi:hypothetical protein T484DRAFT_1755117 [Baffinella frigidus]|nr:hypothetical protein T484DRAFT_1755117 [Cryptophyta sp. CCMP2293]